MKTKILGDFKSTLVYLSSIFLNVFRGLNPWTSFYWVCGKNSAIAERIAAFSNKFKRLMVSRL